jgi:predicted amidohydrolase YtcJ
MGTLREWDAVDLVLSKAPAFSRDDLVNAIAIASEAMAKHGVTWVQDAWVEPGMPEAFEEAQRQNRLKIRYNLAFRADPKNWRNQLDWFVETRARIGQSDNLTANTIKFFADGVIEGHTAALRTAYVDLPNEHGMPVWDWQELTACVEAIDALGFQPHIHAVGDEGLHEALNAIEAAQLANGAKSHPRPVITHVQLLDPADIPRFSKLGVVANFEALWACDDSLQRDLTAPRVGAVREMWQYPMASLLKSGATLSMGSDWPVSDQSPLKAISVAVTRKEPGNPDSIPWNPEERIEVADALVAYTLGSAKQAMSEAAWGKIAVGRSADLVLLAKSPFDEVAENLGDIKVLATWCQGKQVYRSN